MCRQTSSHPPLTTGNMQGSKLPHVHPGAGLLLRAARRPHGASMGAKVSGGDLGNSKDGPLPAPSCPHRAKPGPSIPEKPLFLSLSTCYAEGRATHLLSDSRSAAAVGGRDVLHNRPPRAPWPPGELLLTPLGQACCPGQSSGVVTSGQQEALRGTGPAWVPLRLLWSVTHLPP